jgi:CDP-diacylglycerol--glycerol-3-phosphate 3-phosphatidyltransferase
LFWSVAPLERLILRARVSPNQLTTIGCGVSLLAALALARGWFDVGGWLYLGVGILDIFDGRVARATGRASPGGAFYDSVLDRYAEFAVFVGLAVYYRATAMLPIVIAALIGSLMVSFVRARAESFAAGDVAARGAMQRPERVFVLGVALAASPFVAARLEHAARPRFVVAAAAIAFLALSSNATALGRIRAVLRALS